MLTHGQRLDFGSHAMNIRFALFFLVLLGLLVGLNVLVHRWASQDLRLSERGRKAAKWVLIVGLVALFASRAARFLPGPVIQILGVVGSTVQLGAILAFVLLGLQRLVHRAADGAATMWRRLRPRRPPAPPGSPPPVLSLPTLPRRDLLSQAAAGAALSAGGGASLYGALFGRHDYVIEEVPVRLPSLPSALDGFTIVQLSDVHLGLFVGEHEIRSMLELVARARPDLLVLTGDLIDHDASYADLLGSMVRRLGDHAPVIAVAGNHDYYAGLGSVLGALRRSGATTLVNESRTIAEGAVVLAGVDDMWARRFGAGRGPDVELALAGAPTDKPRILLCHNPAYFAEAAEHVDLQLSGHTHGGQFNPGVRPADLVLPHGWVAGRYQRDGSQLWVNRGFGTAGPPARLGATPEVTKIVLTT